MLISKRYDELVADGAITEDAAQRRALPELDRIADALSQPVKRGFFGTAKPQPVTGLYMWGGVGRGKSMLMDLLVDCVDQPRRRVHFHAFMQELHAAMHKAREKGTQDALAPFLDEVDKSIRLLAFDEMQITDITDAMIVGRLFEGLIERGVTIVTTSNRDPGDLYENGLNRQLFLPFIAYLKEHMVVHHLHSDTDYRQDRLAGSQVYFTPISQDSRAAMNEIWSDLGAADAEAHVIRVKGRDVELPRFAAGVARATFYDLCGRPLGPADYLAIADAVRVLLLDDIPRMGRSNFNEAKRFVTLIDALYEARVRLICSAAAKPEMLYMEGEGAFEFERTASRLREMQSAEWGAER